MSELSCEIVWRRGVVNFAGRGGRYQKSFAPRHGMMRVRIIDREVYVKKLVGWGVLGENWSDRQLNWIEGILSLVESDLHVPARDPQCISQVFRPSP